MSPCAELNVLPWMKTFEDSAISRVHHSGWQRAVSEVVVRKMDNDSSFSATSMHSNVQILNKPRAKHANLKFPHFCHRCWQETSLSIVNVGVLSTPYRMSNGDRTPSLNSTTSMIRPICRPLTSNNSSSSTIFADKKIKTTASVLH
jgi:hypothetical protein